MLLMLECNVIYYIFFAHAYIDFICLIKIHNTKMYTVHRKSASKIQRYTFLLISPSPNIVHAGK